MDLDAPWQGSQKAAQGKAVEAEYDRRRFAQLRPARRQDGDDRRGGRVKRLLSPLVGAGRAEPAVDEQHSASGGQHRFARPKPESEAALDQAHTE